MMGAAFLCLCTCALLLFLLRPLPGSRVNLSSEHTQGAGIRSRGVPAKGKIHRIRYPPHLVTVGKQSSCTAVSVTVAHSQIVEFKAMKGASCPNVAQ